MKTTGISTTRLRRGMRRGVSLVETIIAVGVLAVVAPLALAALLKAGDTSNGAKADTRAPAIVETCLAEVAQARKGSSEYLPTLKTGEDFPGGDDTLCLAFDRAGTLLGKVGQEGYNQGAGKLDGKDISYLTSIKGKLETPSDGSPALLTVTVSVESPALLASGRRTRNVFLTKLP